MRHILLMRHAKSSRDDSSLSDFDRPLAQRGFKDAPRIGTYLKRTGFIPDVVYSSPAKRAKQTTDLVTESAGIQQTSIEWDRELYFSSANAYLEDILGAPDTCTSIMIVGHNPLIEEALSFLITGQRTSAMIMPTSAVACLIYHGKYWNKVQGGSCQLKWLINPKILR